MSLHPLSQYVVPAETAKVASAVFPKGNLWIAMADRIRPFLCDQDFSALFSSQGQPGASPLRLVLVTILQYVEGLTDGKRLLDAILDGNSPNWLRQIPAVETLRKVWIKQYYIADERIQWRTDQGIPPATFALAGKSW